jgi:predicted outer membrane lipoprotein
MSERTARVMPRLVDWRCRPSFVAAINQLVRLGVAPERIFVRLVGAYEDYDGQIRSQDPEAGTLLSDETEVVLDVGISGIVDVMPWQFFTSSGHSSSVSSHWESGARGVMAPIDGHASKKSALMALERMRYEEAVTEPSHFARIIDLFGPAHRRACTADSRLGLWTALMRSFHEWSGNPRGVAWVLGLLLDCRIAVRENLPSEHRIDGSIQSRLNSSFSRLGDDWVLGDCFTDLDSYYELVLCEVGDAHIEEWLPGGSRRSLLEQIMALCNPGHLQWRLRFRLPICGRSIGTQERAAYLGTSWCLTGDAAGVRTDSAGSKPVAAVNG